MQDELAADFRTLTKTLYDLNKALGNSVVRGSPLKELVIENFDEEQIWQQLELQNNAVLDVFKKSVAQCTNDKDLCLISDQEDDSSDAEASSDIEVEDMIEAETEQENAYTEHKTKEAKEKKSKPRESIIEKFSDDDSDVDFDIEALEQETKTAKKTVVKKTGRKSIVDDKFFKLAEMEAFLEHVEKENGEREEEDEDDIDYFEDIISDDEEEEFEETKVKVRISVI